MVKVLTRGGQDLGAVRRHLEYLDRKGELDLETDDGQRLAGKGIERGVLEDWDLDIEECRRKATLEPRLGRRPSKLVHKVLFSMPPGTPPQKVIEAVRNFAREEFGLKHRYAMVLHADEPHPHVHMVIKAVSEQGERLNIRKATLRTWRADFASKLRDLGVPANATERAVRGQNRSPKLDTIYRAERRDDCRRTSERVERIANELLTGRLNAEVGREKMRATRRSVVHGWLNIANVLDAAGRPDLAEQVRKFLITVPPPRTENETIAASILQRNYDRQAQHNR